MPPRSDASTEKPSLTRCKEVEEQACVELVRQGLVQKRRASLSESVIALNPFFLHAPIPLSSEIPAREECLPLCDASRSVIPHVHIRKEEQQTFPGQQFQSRLYFPPKSFTMPNYNRDRSGAVHQILDCLTPVCVGNEQASCTTETEIVSRTTDSNDGPHLGEHSSETLFVAALPQVNGTLICVFSMPLRIPTPPPLPCLSCILTSLNAIRCWFWQGQMPSQASQANRAIHANAAKPLFSKDFR